MYKKSFLPSAFVLSTVLPSIVFSSIVLSSIHYLLFSPSLPSTSSFPHHPRPYSPPSPHFSSLPLPPLFFPFNLFPCFHYPTLHIHCPLMPLPPLFSPSLHFLQCPPLHIHFPPLLFASLFFHSLPPLQCLPLHFHFPPVPLPPLLFLFISLLCPPLHFHCPPLPLPSTTLALHYPCPPLPLPTMHFFPFLYLHCPPPHPLPRNTLVSTVLSLHCCALHRSSFPFFPSSYRLLLFHLYCFISRCFPLH